MPHRPCKRWGQHFLRDHAVLQHLIQTLCPKPHERLLEIGPGQGALTALVLEQVPHLEAIEIDKRLSAHLETRYGSRLSVYQMDVLQFDFTSLQAPLRSLRVFGNLPYNISTPLLFHLLQYKDCLSDMLFMLQKEVALRLCAEPNTADYGRLSVMMQYHCMMRQEFDVDPSAFFPSPKVLSSVVSLKPYAIPPYVATQEAHFAQIVACAFQYRRKTLRNALRELVPPSIFETVRIDPSQRPETLTVSDFVALSNALVPFL